MKLNQPDDNYKFRPFPKASGKYPYRLSVEPFAPVDQDVLNFHMVGDTGSVRNPNFQHQVSSAMARQYSEEQAIENKPAFLYHLGDIVYNFGEAASYPTQFFAPYEHYPGAIFAIAGNHDSDINPEAETPYQSLDAFKAVFCDSERQLLNFGSGTKRLSMVQPNIFWTLETSLATFIGLHSNVPKYGVIPDEQRNWFLEELRYANSLRPEKAVIVCIHHAPYSADTNHGSSIPMISFLENAFEETNVRPDTVFSGHVHNYQRFHKTYADGKVVPFIVAGAGGFDELHSIAEIGDERYSDNHSAFENVELQNYCDNKHGFLKISLNRQHPGGIILRGEYYTLSSNEVGQSTTSLADKFEIMIN